MGGLDWIYLLMVGASVRLLWIW